ncbi:MAG: glutathione binding-like protein [Pseudomonadota bacterium]|nr:glutathione binding-like protein [Pseudomonadota bacterium]
MIELHYAPTPNGHKIAIALEELGLDYEVHRVNIGEGDQFKSEFLAFSPNNRIPAIIDHGADGDEPVTVFESGAILVYLAEKTGRLMPASGDGRKTVMEWLMWQMGGFGPMLGQAHHFNFYAKDKIGYAMDRYSNEANRLYGVLDRRLQGRDFVAGDYSIADIAIFPWTRTYERQNVAIGDYPNVVRWRKAIFDRPAVQRGMKVGSEWREDLRSLSNEEWNKLFGA